MSVAARLFIALVSAFLLACPTPTPEPDPPTISEVDPASGPIAGGVWVTVIGSGFLNSDPGVTEVSFGADDAPECLIINDEGLRCLTPAGPDGAVTVRVDNDNGEATLEEGYTYEAPRVLYGADGKTGEPGNFYIIQPDTAESELVGPVGYAITGLCMDPDGALWGTESTQSGSRGYNARLLAIDPETGVGAPIGELFDGAINHNSTADCTFVGDRMVGWSESGDDPIEINTTTGAATVIGDSGVSSSGSGIATAPDGTVYFVPGRVNGSLYTINPTTGIGFEGPTLSGGTYDNLNSIAYLNGVLYGIDTQDMGSINSLQVLVSIDVTTGVMTPIGDLPTGIDSLVGSVPVETN